MHTHEFEEGAADRNSHLFEYQYFTLASNLFELMDFPFDCNYTEVDGGGCNKAY